MSWKPGWQPWVLSYGKGASRVSWLWSEDHTWGHFGCGYSVKKSLWGTVAGTRDDQWDHGLQTSKGYIGKENTHSGRPQSAEPRQSVRRQIDLHSAEKATESAPSTQTGPGSSARCAGRAGCPLTGMLECIEWGLELLIRIPEEYIFLNPHNQVPPLEILLESGWCGALMQRQACTLTFGSHAARGPLWSFPNSKMVILGFDELFGCEGTPGWGLREHDKGWGASRELRILWGHLVPAGGTRPELPSYPQLALGHAQRCLIKAQRSVGPVGEDRLPSLNVPSSAGLGADCIWKPRTSAKGDLSWCQKVLC